MIDSSICAIWSRSARFFGTYGTCHCLLEGKSGDEIGDGTTMIAYKVRL